MWEFEWWVFESFFGVGGLIEGMEVFSVGEDGCYYWSCIEVRGLDGLFFSDFCIVYLFEQKVFVCYEVDSCGFEVFKVGCIGGDLGGFYIIYYEIFFFGVGGNVVQLWMVTCFVLLVNFRVEFRISVDDGFFMNFGIVWWIKNVFGVTLLEQVIIWYLSQLFLLVFFWLLV